MAKFGSPSRDGFWTALIKRLAWPIIICSLVLTGLSVYYSLTRLHFSLSRTELVASDLHLIRLTQELEREFGERDQFVVVVEHPDKGRAIAFAEALAERLRPQRERFPEIFYRVDPEPFRKWALQYLKRQDLLDLKAKLTEHRQILEAIAAEPLLTRFFQVVNQEITRAMISEVFTSFLEDKEEEPIPDLTLFNAVLRELERHLAGQEGYRSPLKSLLPGDLGDLSQEGYFFTDNDKYLLFLVTTRQDGFTNIYEDLELLRAEVAAVRAQFPEVVVGVTGPAALSADEMAGAFADINLASWLSLFLQVAIMVLFFRSLKRPLVQGIVLAIGIAWTMGVATLVVGRLNILSIVFAPLMLGICVDFGIHWYSRLEEEQGSLPYCHDAIFERTVRGANPGNFYAALAALFSILPLAFTGFKGLEELGIIVTLGILVYLVAIFVLLPALAYVTEGCRRHQDRTEPPPPAAPEPFFSLNWAKPEVVVALGLLVTVLGAVSLWYVPFDLNPLRLQNQRTESVVWELKILQESRYSSSYGTMVSTDLAELPRKVEALKAKPTVSHVESVLSFLPEEPESKLPLIAEMAPILTQVRFAPPAVSEQPVDLTELAGVLGRIRFKLSQAKDSDWKPGAKPVQEQLDEANLLLARLIPRLQTDSPEVAARLLQYQRHLFADFRDKWDLLASNVGSSVPTINDLPQAVKQRFVSPRDHYLIRIFPSIDIWDPEPLGRFVADLQSVDPNVVGDPVLLYVFNFAFKNACLWAAGVALLAIFLLLWFLLRSLSFALLALIPLIVGTALTLCLMWLLGLTFNQANVLFLPLILGEGIEYGIIILVRWKLEASARAITLPRSTAKGVALAALTTAFGFGSMMISGHQGTFSLGLLSTVGSLSVLVAALTVLPAFLRVLERVLVPTPVPCPRALASTDD